MPAFRRNYFASPHHRPHTSRTFSCIQRPLRTFDPASRINNRCNSSVQTVQYGVQKDASHQCSAGDQCHISHHHPQNKDSKKSKKLNEASVARKTMRSCGIYLELSSHRILAQIHLVSSQNSMDTPEKCCNYLYKRESHSPTCPSFTRHRMVHCRRMPPIRNSTSRYNWVLAIVQAQSGSS